MRGTVYGVGITLLMGCLFLSLGEPLNARQDALATRLANLPRTCCKPLPESLITMQQKQLLGAGKYQRLRELLTEEFRGATLRCDID